MRKFLNAFAAIMMLGSVSSIFTGCSDEEAPDPSVTVEEAKVVGTLYVNEDFLEAFDVYAQTEQGEKIALSSVPTMVNIFEKEVPMYYLTIEGIGESLPVSSRVLLGYKAKDLDNMPSSRNYIIAAESYGYVNYKDGSVNSYLHQWYIGRYQEEFLDWGFEDDINTYMSHIEERFGELNSILDEKGFRFSTTNHHWSDITSEP